MAGSYFELLTEQQGIPAKPFDPVEELKRLRRGLTLRMQTSASAADKIADPPPFLPTGICSTEAGTKDTVPFLPYETKSPEIEPVSLEAVVKTASEMKKTLAIWQRSRLRTKSVRSDMFRGHQKFRSKRQNLLAVAQHLIAPQEKTLESFNTGLMALGIIGVIFGVLSVLRGMESDLSLGSLVCAAGAAIVGIGLGGRLLASR